MNRNWFVFGVAAVALFLISQNRRQKIRNRLWESELCDNCPITDCDGWCGV